MLLRSSPCSRRALDISCSDLRLPKMSRYATAQATTRAPDFSNIQADLPLSRWPRSQPPSHKPPEFRRSQLHREYTSLIKSTPLMVLFQHNNLTASEWASIRRELDLALQKTGKELTGTNKHTSLAEHIKIQVIKTGVFGAALRVAEYYDPEEEAAAVQPDDPAIASSVATSRSSRHIGDSQHKHSLSRAAHQAVLHEKGSHPLEMLLNGPVAVLTFPSVSTTHLKTAFSILAPSAPYFPAPTRKSSPGYYELQVQSGLPKLMLLGALVEKSVFDLEKTKWVGTIHGGIDGLRSQLVTTLQSAGAVIASNLGAASKSIYFTLEAHRATLEESSEDVKDR